MKYQKYMPLLGWTIAAALTIGLGKAINSSQEEKKNLNLTAVNNPQKIIKNFLDKAAQIQSALEDLLSRREQALEQISKL